MIGYSNSNRRGYGPPPGYIATAAQSNLLIQRVSYLLATSLVVSAASAYVFKNAFGLMWPMIIGAFVVLLGLNLVARKPGLNVLMFYLFSALEGGSLGPLLNMYVRHYGANLVWEAFLLTSIAVGGIGTYAYTSGKDFSFLARWLMVALFAFIIGGIALAFVHVPALHTTTTQLGWDLGIVVLFVGFLLYDFSRIRLRYSPEDYILAAVNVYLDFLNLFMAILNILGIMQDSRRR